MFRVFLVVTALVFAVAGNALASDATKGKKVFKKCVACHTVNEGGKKKIGPNLFAIVGRKFGASEGYKYSKSYIAAGQAGLTWTEDAIFEYLADPRKYMRKVSKNPKARSKMVFKLRKEADRRAVISYLAAQK